jgi:hypothetical protein
MDQLIEANTQWDERFNKSKIPAVKNQGLKRDAPSDDKGADTTRQIVPTVDVDENKLMKDGYVKLSGGVGFAIWVSQDGLKQILEATKEP